MERKHKTCKRIAGDHYNTKSFEKGIMEPITCQSLYDLQIPRTGVFLTAQKKPSQRLLAALSEFVSVPVGVDLFTSKGVSVESRVVQLNDAVMFQSNGSVHMGRVNFHVQIGSECVTCISLWTIIQKKTQCTTCADTGETILIASSQILETCVYRILEASGAMCVLLPPKFRVASM
ncbi:unnamed protein product [Prorocentrum cordatum]|uniref:Altered inheritance of mitochondria protein 24, mitochondrial n=1 Tax=Prorocentrum cordatum TaxID=2364126 RepID=A0ABN9XSF4_9DINO|nr:unnamed protein product [Polarella glacialis]